MLVKRGIEKELVEKTVQQPDFKQGAKERNSKRSHHESKL